MAKARRAAKRGAGKSKTKAAAKRRPKRKRKVTRKLKTKQLVAEAGAAKPRSGPKPKPPPVAPANTVTINRAPVLTLWAAVVAERRGFDADAALTLGKAVAGLNAQSKGRRLGIFGPPKPAERGGPPKKVGLGEEFWVEVCGRSVPGKHTPDGIRAVVKDEPLDPDAVRRYLAGKFGESLDAALEAMRALARAFGPERLEERAYALYERFRPEIEPGRRGWGQKGTLDLALIRSLAEDS